jgi:hypothetical protein
MEDRSSRSLRVWVVQRRERAGDTWSPWATISEAQFTGDGSAAATPMEGRAWGECTYFFADQVADERVEWRLLNLRTGEDEPQEPLG